jgi:hypothetical protein
MAYSGQKEGLGLYRTSQMYGKPQKGSGLNWYTYFKGGVFRRQVSYGRAALGDEITAQPKLIAPLLRPHSPPLQVDCES